MDPSDKPKDDNRRKILPLISTSSVILGLVPRIQTPLL